MATEYNRGMVRFVEHDRGREAFANETIEKLWHLFGSMAEDIQHVGSTAIKGIKAEPVIDIAVAVKDPLGLGAVMPALEAAGFLYRECTCADHKQFVYGDINAMNGETTCLVHVVKAHDKPWHDYILFRDYLNAKPAVAKAYEALTIQLGEENAGDEDRSKVTDEIDGFIKRTLREALVWRYLGRRVTVTINRPPNGGYIADETAADGKAMEAFVIGVNGPSNTFTGDVIAAVLGKDDVADKPVVAPKGMFFTASEIERAVGFREHASKTRLCVRQMDPGLDGIPCHDSFLSVLRIFIAKLHDILCQNPVSVCLYGSCATGDAIVGVSDIDLIACTQNPLSKEALDQLVGLRQHLAQKHGNPLFLAIEGAVLSMAGLWHNSQEKAVYWGTTGQKTTDGYRPDCFARKAIKEHGIMLWGEDLTNSMPLPSWDELVQGVEQHYHAVKTHAWHTFGKPTSLEWFFTIARGIYTVDTGGCLSKAEAVKWVLKKGLAPDPDRLKEILFLRENPSRLIGSVLPDYGDDIQRFAQVLYQRIQNRRNIQTAKDELWDVYDANRRLAGRTHRRGDPMAEGDYHLVVHVWIRNRAGQYLITKRTPNKGYPNMWESTGGSALAGDDSLAAAMREVKEETGLVLLPENGKCLMSLQGNDSFCDVWLFRQDFSLSKVIFQENETCDAKWAAPDEIKTMMAEGTFVPFHYIDCLFEMFAGE